MFTAVHLVALLATYTYAVLFPLTVVEGPIITILAGYLASLGYVNPFLVYAIVVAGDMTGDLAWYAAGRWGRQRYTGKWSKYVGITPERLLRIEKHFESHSGKTLVLGKLTQAVGALVLVGAGAAGVRPRRFIVFNLLATLPKSLALLLFGYYFGKAYGHAGSVLNYVALGTIALAVLAAMIYLIPRRFARQFR
jgi:membrane protein DedA with SNARE-associated domain